MEIMKTYKLTFAFNRDLSDTLKKMWGATFNQNGKLWVVIISEKDSENWPKWLVWAGKKNNIAVEELS
jgi:hypothetical protein